ncbi:MAG: hypothetical protein ACK4NC_06195 [Candidatus Gracilibacteria bacterium]
MKKVLLIMIFFLVLSPTKISADNQPTQLSITYGYDLKNHKCDIKQISSDPLINKSYSLRSKQLEGTYTSLDECQSATHTFSIGRRWRLQNTLPFFILFLIFSEIVLKKLTKLSPITRFYIPLGLMLLHVLHVEFITGGDNYFEHLLTLNYVLFYTAVLAFISILLYWRNK